MRPYVTIKFAQSLDGKIAARHGSASRISGPEALRFAHSLRAQHDAVLVGIGTVLADNPRLTTRLVKGKNPVKIVLDSHLRTRGTVLAPGARTVIFTTKRASGKRVKALEARGAEVIRVPGSEAGGIDLTRILRILYKKGIKKLLVEGGAKVISSFLGKDLADKIIVIIAPVILGEGLQASSSAAKFRLKNVKKLGRDIICEFAPKKGSR